MPRVNHGALFGMGGEHKGLANRIFAAISLIASVGIVIFVLLKGRVTDGWMLAALGLILGGTLGNFYDRVVFNGVRDFLYFYKIKWPVFNIADCCLVCGAIMLVVHALLFPQPSSAAGSATPSLAAEPKPTT
jgi:lipoprotein signal peptidase